MLFSVGAPLTPAGGSSWRDYESLPDKSSVSFSPNLQSFEVSHQTSSSGRGHLGICSRVLGGPLSPWRKATTGRFKLLKRKFKFGAGSLSEEIPDPDPQILEG